MIRETITIEFNLDPLWGARWIATFEGYDGPESPIGSGDDPVEAVEALLEMAGIDALKARLRRVFEQRCEVAKPFEIELDRFYDQQNQEEAAYG